MSRIGRHEHVKDWVVTQFYMDQGEQTTTREKRERNMTVTKRRESSCHVSAFAICWSFVKNVIEVVGESRGYIQLREQGAYNNLLAELNADGSLRNYIRTTKSQLDDIVERMTPVVQRTNTNFQAASTPNERLAVTLRFLATGA